MNEVPQRLTNGSLTERLVYFPRSSGCRVPFEVYSSPEIYALAIRQSPARNRFRHSEFRRLAATPRCCGGYCRHGRRANACPLRCGWYAYERAIWRWYAGVAKWPGHFSDHHDRCEDA